MLRRWPTKRTSAGGESGDVRVSSEAPGGSRELHRIKSVVEVDGYLDYLMTESNVGAAVRSGASLTEIRSSYEAGLRQFFQGSLPVDFES
jgi:hypothetical protein